MFFGYSAELEEFRLSVREFFERRLPHAQLPTLLERGNADGELWAPMAEQLGLQAMTIADELGGSGYGMVELTVALEEAGRALVPGSLFATLLGVTALQLAADQDLNAKILPDVASGRCKLAVAMSDEPDAPATVSRSGGRWQLSGGKVRVPAVGPDDRLLVFASGASDASGSSGQGGVSLFLVEPDAARIEPVQTFDISRPLTTVCFAESETIPVGSVGDGERIAAELDVVGALMLAAEQVGGADRCLEIATHHAQERSQFGRPIGSFQAVKHHCANMLVRMEAARTAVLYAAAARDGGHSDQAVSVSVAKAAASDAYWNNARMCVQVLGGIGFTFEHPAQLHFKRATATAQQFGSPAAHREAIARHMISATGAPA